MITNINYQYKIYYLKPVLDQTQSKQNSSVLRR